LRLPFFSLTASFTDISYPQTPVPQAHNSSALALVFKPAQPNADGNVDYVDITVALDKIHVDARQTLLQLSIAESNVQTIALDVKELTAIDATGQIPLTVQNDNS
jgi:hypothetical protein